MTSFTPVVTYRSVLDSHSITNGSLYFVSDTKELFIDFDDVRSQVQDVVVLATDADRALTLAPLNKFYYIKETNILWYYNTDWIKVSDTDSKIDVSAITKVLSSSSTDSQVPSAKAVYDAISSIQSQLGDIDTTLDQILGNS